MSFVNNKINRPTRRIWKKVLKKKYNEKEQRKKKERIKLNSPTEDVGLIKIAEKI